MEFFSSSRAAENRLNWKGIVAMSSVEPKRPFWGYGIEKGPKSLSF